jgi:hypothetical protein
MRQHVLDLDRAQARPPWPESLKVYRAILALRARGLRVWRRGREHLVGGRQLSTRQMMAQARAEAGPLLRTM